DSRSSFLTALQLSSIVSAKLEMLCLFRRAYSNRYGIRRPQVGAAGVGECYGASAPAGPPVLAAAAEIFLGAWQHGIVGEYPVNAYLYAPWGFPNAALSSAAVYKFPLVSIPIKCPMLEVPV